MGIRSFLRAYASVPTIAAPPDVPTVMFADGRARIGVVEFGGAQRGLTFQQVWGRDIEDALKGSASGQRVDVETAIRNIAVQAAWRLLTNDVGSLPTDAFRKVSELERKQLTTPTWVRRPNPNNPNETWEDHVKQLVFSLVSEGESFTYALPSVFDPQALTVVNPKDITIPKRTSPFEAKTYGLKGVDNVLSGNEIIHIPWMLRPGSDRGVNPIEAAEQGLGIALAADEFVASYFGQGAVLSGWIEFPPGADPTPQQVKDIKEDFKRKHQGSRKSHAAGALTGGAKFVPFEYNNRDAQLLELRDSIVEDVARLYGIPPHMLGSQKPGAVGYASVEQRSIDYVTHAILPITRRIETGYSRLLRGPETYLKFNVRGLLEADHQARAQYLDRLLQNKVIRREEVRAKEDLPFDPEAVGYLETPNNNAPEEPAAQEPAA